jgi:hypothetical protein
MSKFTTPLIVEHIDGRIWEVAQPFEYHLVYPAKYTSDIIYVHKKFRMDFASIPRIFWSILPPTGLYGKAAVIHDWLYRTQIYTRKRADQIFLEAMEVLGVAKWKRVVIYRSVRMFGWNAWRKRGKNVKK